MSKPEQVAAEEDEELGSTMDQIFKDSLQDVADTTVSATPGEVEDTQKVCRGTRARVTVDQILESKFWNT